MMLRQPAVFLATGRTGGVGLYTDCTGCAGIGDAAGMTGMPAMAGIALGEAVPPGTIFARSAPGCRLRCQPGQRRSAIRDMASSNSCPDWYRSSGRLDKDF